MPKIQKPRENEVGFKYATDDSKHTFDILCR